MKPAAKAHGLGDFTTDARVIPISLLAIAIGFLSTGVAWALLRLIGFFTNLFYYHRLGSALVSPAGNHLGAWAILVPVGGSIVIGLMARYGSERIRGHGIPEALESILINGSRVPPRLAILKPLSSAISIGSGGPFGAEGPIIMTGGAVGSMIAQFFHLTSVERKTLLVAGAAAGMSATFASPVAAVLLAIELLLFEWKPRSLIPVALASATAGAARRYILGLGPLFPVPAHPVFIGPEGLLGCVICGLLAGVLSALLTGAVYAAEDAFLKLPIHWMWWPAIGGVVVGVGGLIFPQALGVGYDTIGNLLRGDVARTTILGILLVKSVIWAVSLGSGTSGGVLAPLLMMGGALGGIETMFLPPEGAGFWPLVSMGAILGGTMRSPLTGIIFALELTHDINVLLPLLVASRDRAWFYRAGIEAVHFDGEGGAPGLSFEPRIRGRPAGDPVRAGCDADQSGGVRGRQHSAGRAAHHERQSQAAGPISLSGGGRSPSAAGRGHQKAARRVPGRYAAIQATLAEIAKEPVVAYPDEPLRVVVYRMAETGLTRFPVVDRSDERKLVGVIGLRDLLSARTRNLAEERDRERVLRVWLPLSGARQDGRRHRSRTSERARCSQSQQAFGVAVRDPLAVSGAHRQLIQESARLRHGAIRVIGGEHDPVDAHLKQQIEEGRREIEAAEGVVDVLAQIGADRSLKPGDGRRHDVHARLHEGERFAHVPHQELQFRKPVERAAQDNAQHVDRGFDVPAPSSVGEHEAHARRKSLVRRFHHGRRRLGRMNVKGNTQRDGAFQNRPEKLVVQIAAPMVTVDERSFEAVLADHPFQFVGRFLGSGNRQSGKSGKPLGIALDRGQ